MSSSITVPVDLDSRSYEILIEVGLMDRLGESLQAISPTLGHVIVITDDTVAPLYLEKAKEQIGQATDRIDSVIIPAGESSKSIRQCELIWEKLQSFAADRSSTIIALGGGVVGDLAGFVAATYGRGIRFIQIPTTLLAQVDSSVGGKTGINLPTAKNMVGSFWQPTAVFIDPDVLSTLDSANVNAGMAEVIKYGMIMDESFFGFLESNVTKINQRDPEIISQAIARSCHCKAKIVEEDERETSGRRAILNYGHTYAHAIESVFGYGTYLHGHAVAIGMNCAIRLAKQLDMIGPDSVDRQNELLTNVGLEILCPGDRHDQLISAMKRDKKVVGRQLKMILPNRIGHVELVDAPSDSQIAKSLVEST